MVGLTDLAPATETVMVRDTAIPVHGVSAKGLAYLLGRFPELRRLMTGLDVGVDQLLTMGGDAVGSIIAAGCGQPADEQAEAAAGLLPIDTQAEFLAVILRLTLPRGIGPFVAKVTALASILDVDAAQSDTAQASMSLKPSTP